jgi:hypothetical protein
MIAVVNASLIDEGSPSEQTRFAFDHQYLAEPQAFEFEGRFAAKKTPANYHRIQRGIA